MFVQSPEEALLALDFEAVEFIQLPFNILDYRWDVVIEKILQVRQHRPIVIHARSALLQGLLTTSKMDLWQEACCSNAAEVVDWLRNKAEIYTNGDVVDLSLRYVFSQPWIDGVVIGVETKEQLIDNLVRISSDIWTESVVSRITEDCPRVPAETLNPAKWRQHD